jgi:hypothetical protein
MCRSGISFSPTPTTREDRAGSPSATPAGSGAYFPLSVSLTNGVRTTQLGGALTSYADNGVLAQVVADLRGGVTFPNITSANTTMGYLRGATTDIGTFVVWDQFVCPSTIGNIRRNFWSFNKPVISGETVLQGGSTAGVLSATGDHVVIQQGSYQATIQMVSTMAGINLVGGAGYESFFDGYASGGSNLDFLTNAQSNDATRQAQALWLQNQWRTSFLTTQAIATEMLFVITVGALGSTAPTYTRASALAILNSASIVMPGQSQIQAQAQLNNALTFPCWLGLLNTVGQDSGSGFVEPSGNGYARLQMVSGNWGSAALGSPCTRANIATLTLGPATGAGWGTLNGAAIYDAVSGGNVRWSDYLGPGTWTPFTCSAASPGVLTSAGHGLTNGQLVAVTPKYGGALPPGGSWAGLLTVANATTDTFTVGVNTTGTGEGSFKLVVPQAILATQSYTFPAGQLVIQEA